MESEREQREEKDLGDSTVNCDTYRIVRVVIFPYRRGLSDFHYNRLTDFERISQDDIIAIQRAFADDGVEGVQGFLKETLKEWKTTPLNLAVIGNSGVGKSSFINAIRCARRRFSSNSRSNVIFMRSSVIAEGPRDASCQLKSCQLPRSRAVRQVLNKSKL